MLLLVALTALALGLGFGILLPILSLVRANAIARALEDLRRQVRSLQEEVRRLAAQSGLQGWGGPHPAPEVPAALRAAPEPTPVTAVRSIPAQPAAPPAPLATPPATPRAPADFESLETRIGARWMLYVGVTVLVLGVSFFLKYAFDNRWITETLRVAIGGGAGVALLYAGGRFERAGHVRYGQILAGGGLAVLYLSVYAALNLYGLIGRPVAFALMVAITAAASWLADRRRALGLAAIAVGGGFLTPFIVGGDRDAQAVLFTYDAVLVAGTMYLARRGGWPQLNLASFLLTGLTVIAWFVRHYTSSKYLATELFFALFCAMFLYVLRENRRATHRLARLVTVALAFGPVVYHAASVTILYDHDAAFLVYLIAVTLAAIVISARTSAHDRLRLAAWFAAVLPLYAWTNDHAGAPWFAESLTTIGAIYALHLIAQLDAIVRRGLTLRAADLALVHLNGLGSFAVAYLALDAVYPEAAGTVAALAAIGHAVLAFALREHDINAAHHVTALGLGLAAVAVAIEFEGPWVTFAWAAEGAGIVWVGLRVNRAGFRHGGAALMAIAVVRLLTDGFFESRIPFTPLLNARFAASAFIVGLLYGLVFAYRRRGRDLPKGTGPAIARLVLAANGLTILAGGAEINSFWNARYETAMTANLARELMLSLFLAAYAGGLIAIGIRRRYAPIRYLAIGVFGLTIIKVFLVDLSELGGIYRVFGFIALGAILLAASYLYQRRLLKPET